MLRLECILSRTLDASECIFGIRTSKSSDSFILLRRGVLGYPIEDIFLRRDILRLSDKDTPNVRVCLFGLLLNTLDKTFKHLSTLALLIIADL